MAQHLIPKKSWADKLFPPPEPGASRIIPSRHEVQVSLMVAFIISSVFFIFQGAGPATALAAAPLLVVVSVAAISIFGSLLCLLAAAIAERKPWDALGCSLSGFTLLTVVLAFSTWNYIENFPDFLQSGPFWTTACLTIGFGWRVLHLSIDAIRIWRHR